MQEIFPLFHHRRKDTQSSQSPHRGGGTAWHLLNCQGPISPPSYSPNITPTRMDPTFVFLQNILIGLEVFLFVREHVSLRCVQSHNPDSTNWTFTSSGQGHNVCLCACVCMCLCVCVLKDSRVIGAVVALKRKRPTSLPCLRSIQWATLPLWSAWDW